MLGNIFWLLTPFVYNRFNYIQYITNTTFRNFLAFSPAGTSYVKNDGIPDLKWSNGSSRLCPLHFCKFVFKSKREHLWNLEKCFLLHSKSFFISRGPDKGKHFVQNNLVQNISKLYPPIKQWSKVYIPASTTKITYFKLLIMVLFFNDVNQFKNLH